MAVENKGGLIMPLQMDITLDDGTIRRVRLPADVWRKNEKLFTYGFFTDKDVVKVVVDPDEVFADVNRDNNSWSKVPPAAS